MILQISRLNPATTPAQIAASFLPFRISSFSKIHTIADVSRSRTNTFCYITIEDPGEGGQAILQHHGRMLLDAEIAVTESK